MSEGKGLVGARLVTLCLGLNGWPNGWLADEVPLSLYTDKACHPETLIPPHPTFFLLFLRVPLYAPDFQRRTPTKE